MVSRALADGVQTNVTTIANIGMFWILTVKFVKKMWLQGKKISIREFENIITIVLERTSCDFFVAFCDLLVQVKKLWLHSDVATPIALNHSFIFWCKFYLGI